ncbi:unnamed protein product [Caenorhabditis auriculariae]|uniref:Uncharacterized protein n=1 Tax=Caenorhabditis auriculariae TaxID=2777116 RepID=A0A8S1GQS2_9PELO|nr:unnamed protein product [Caenorhabditis auriculariae]
MVRSSRSQKYDSSADQRLPLFHSPPSNQTQYLTVPTMESFRGACTAREESLMVESEPSTVFCMKACGCIGIVFLFCLLTVFVYAVLIAKYSASPNMGQGNYYVVDEDPEQR